MPGHPSGLLTWKHLRRSLAACWTNPYTRWGYTGICTHTSFEFLEETVAIALDSLQAQPVSMQYDVSVCIYKSRRALPGPAILDRQGAGQHAEGD